jgi:hypothetical protein
MKKVKKLYIDIETTPNGVWSWVPYGKNWRATGMIVPWFILCFAAKWEGQKTKVYSVRDYKGYKPQLERFEDGSVLIRQPNDKGLLEDLHQLLSEADIVIGHNLKAFDDKKIVSRLLTHGFPPPAPYTKIDTLKEHKKIAAPNSNRLDDLAQQYGLGKKLDHEGFPLWVKCMEGDPKAWNKMERYCKQDVDVGFKLYEYLAPWMESHPSLNVYADKPSACPLCLRQNTIIFRGHRKLAGGRLRKILHCAPNRGGCGKYIKGELFSQQEKIILR